MKAVKTFGLTKLQVANHLAFHHDAFVAFHAEMFANQPWNALLIVYRDELNVYDEVVKRQRASVYTADVHEADRVRDEAMHYFFAIVDNATRSNKAEVREAGAKLKVVVKPYRKDHRGKMAAQTEQVFGMIRDLQEEDNYERVGTIGAADAVGRVRTTNLEFQELYRQRYEERENQAWLGIDTRVQRRAVDSAYRALTDVLNSMSTADVLGVDSGFDPPKLATVIVQINAVVSQFRLNLANQSKRRKPTTEEELRDEARHIADLRDELRHEEHRLHQLEETIEHTAEERARNIIAAAEEEINHDEEPLHHHDEGECE